MDKLDPELQAPIIHTLTAHVTKEKPVFFYVLGLESGLSDESKKGIAASVDLLWALSLIYDDIEDNDPHRAGMTSAWKEYGKVAALKSFVSGVGVVSKYLVELSGPDTVVLIQNYADRALKSVGEQKELKLGCSISEVIENYSRRICFHADLPVDLLFPVRSEERHQAFEAIYNVNLAGQILNDLKDMSSDYGWLRAGYTDLRSGVVTYPIAYLWERVDTTQREVIKNLFGKKEISAEELESFAGLFSQKILYEIKSEIEVIYQKSINAFEKVTLPDVAKLASKWVSSKLGQLKGLRI
jgi:geranylgeranyl pyrophosphate synthase